MQSVRTSVKTGYLLHPAGFENAPLMEEMEAELSPEVLKIILFKGQTGGMFRYYLASLFLVLFLDIYLFILVVLDAFILTWC